MNKLRWGLLLVGVHGASASTLVTSLLSETERMSASFHKGSYWCTLNGTYPEEIHHLNIGGWDYRYDDLEQAVQHNAVRSIDNDKLHKLKPFPAIIGLSDYAVQVEGKLPSHRTLEAAIETVQNNIQSFRQDHNLDRVIVINMSSPMYCGSEESSEWSSTTAYAVGTVREGADWVEFTPSDSITESLCHLAQQTGSRLAGRDGSTGQTILKLALRDFFQARGLAIASWYSTNLIGNRDGVVLNHPDYRVTKLRDKTSVLTNVKQPAGEQSAGEQSPNHISPNHISPNHISPNHIVEIQYVPPAGDNKESWDCIHFSGWLDAPMSLRLNWHGADSFLAAPLMLDIVSGLIHAHAIDHPPGLVEPLGMFFKFPLGAQFKTFNQLHDDLQTFAESAPVDGSRPVDSTPVDSTPVESTP